MSKDRAKPDRSYEDAAPGVTTEQLAGISLFADTPAWALARLAGSAVEKQLPQDALVVRQNDEAKAVYVLLEGTVQVLVHFEGVGDLLMGVHREPGSLIGWSAFLAPYRYTDSVRSEEPSKLLRLPRQTFEEIFDEDKYLGYRILKKAATTVDNRLESAVDFLEKPT